MSNQLSLMILAVGAGCAAGGCSSSGTPPPAPPASAMQGTHIPAAAAKQHVRSVSPNLNLLSFSTQSTFQVDLPDRSLDVVKHYDSLAAKRGWVKKQPRQATDPGARKWISTGARIGPTDAYDAAWEDPKTGRVAVLNLWQVAGEGDRQHGTFEIFPKEQSPFASH